MANLRERILKAEGATREARQRMLVSRRVLKQVLRRKAVSPVALLSAFVTGFAVAHSRRASGPGNEMSKHLHQFIRLGMIGVWSVGYDMLVSALGLRRT